MLPSSCHCNLKQGCFIASEKTPGTLIHTHIYLLRDVHTDFHCEEKLCDSKRLCLSGSEHFFRIEIKLQHLWEERRNLTRKALHYRKELDRVRSWFLLYFFLFISSPFRCLFPFSPPSPSPQVCWFSASFLTLSHNLAILLHTIQNIHLYPPF